MPRRSFPIFLKSMYPTFQQFSRKDFNLTLFQMRKYYFCPCSQLKHSVFQSVISNNTQRQLQMQIQQRLPLTHTHTHTRLTALCPGLLVWAGTREVKPIWILLKQETVSGSGISWTVCKSARTLLQTDNHTSTPPLSFYRPDALPAAQPTASKHWRHYHWNKKQNL